MLAPLAHHLGTSRVPLNWHVAHGTGLDVVKGPDVQEPAVGSVLLLVVPNHFLAVLLARLPGVEVPRAPDTEALGAARAVGRARLIPRGVADVANGLTVGAGAPSPVRIQCDLCADK